VENIYNIFYSIQKYWPIINISLLVGLHKLFPKNVYIQEKLIKSMDKLDVKVVIDIDELVKCISEKRLPENMKVFFNQELPDWLKDVDAALLIKLKL
jgi:hypothetical protein